MKFFALLFAFVIGCAQQPAAVVVPGAPASVSGPAACVGADGLNHCGPGAKSAHALKKAGTFGASAGGTRANTIPPSWTVPAWFIDPSNTTTCASDNNNCTQAACGAAGSFAGPCVTGGEIEDRWGTWAPRLRQQTVWTLMSSQPAGDADPWYPDPTLENNAGFAIEGVPSVVATGVLASVVAAATPATFLSASVSGGVAVEQMIVNSTHPSVAWLYQNVSGSTWNITQPMTGFVPFVTIGDATNAGAQQPVNTWANGDVYTVYSLPSVALSTASAVVEYWGATAASTFPVYRIHISTPTVGSLYQSLLGDGIMFAESSSDRIITGVTSSCCAPSSVEGLYNTYAYGGVQNTESVYNVFTSAGILATSYSIIAGAVGHNGGGALNIDKALFFSNPVLGGGSFSTFGAGAINSVFLDGTFLIVNGNTSVNTFGAFPALVWGSGSIHLGGNGQWGWGALHYDQGAGKAVAYFKQSGGMTMNGYTTGYAIVGTVFTAGITISPANLDANAGATKGGLFEIPGSSITNY